MAWVYILHVDNGQYYIGSTVDIDKRLRQHAYGHTATTNRLGVGTLVLRQEYGTLKDARSVECKLKKLKRKDYIEKIVKDGYIKILP